MRGPRASTATLKPEQPGRLEHQRTAAQPVHEPGARVAYVARAALVRPHHEELAAGAVLPTEAQVAAEGAVVRVVLHERAREHARAERIVCTRAEKVLVHLAAGEIDAVDGQPRLE